jgi:hypothetical protein
VREGLGPKAHEGVMPPAGAAKLAHDLDRPGDGAELAGHPGGHLPLQDRKPSPGGRTGSRVAGPGYSRAVHAAPRPALKSGAELALHLAGGAELRQPSGDRR